MVASAHSPLLLLTGAPGVGKTTVVRRVASALSARRIGGFYTEELREQGERVGFRLVGFDGLSGVIAHVGLSGPHRVAKYGVDVAAIERLAESTLRPDSRRELYLVDEIGKMECLAPGFVAAMRLLFGCGAPLVATVAQRGGGFIEEAKHRADAELWEITSSTRDAAPERVVAWLAARLDRTAE